MNPCTSQIVIPARLASTRLPRKLLLGQTGKTLLEHTYEAASRSWRPNGVCVAADTAQIFAACRAFGGNVEITDPQGGERRRIASPRSPGDWRASISSSTSKAMSRNSPGSSIDLVIGLLEEDAAAVMATLATPIRTRRVLEDPACVKWFSMDSGRAPYFSRSPIPRARDWDDGLPTAEPPYFMSTRAVCLSPRVFPAPGPMPQSPLEQLENLDSLRVLESGHAILRRRGRRADFRHRHAGRLSAVCRAVAAKTPRPLRASRTIWDCPVFLPPHCPNFRPTKMGLSPSHGALLGLDRRTADGIMAVGLIPNGGRTGFDRAV